MAQAHTHARRHRGASDDWPWSLLRICQGQTWWCKESYHRSYPAGKQKGNTAGTYTSHSLRICICQGMAERGQKIWKLLVGVVFNGRATTSAIGRCSSKVMYVRISDKSWMDYIGFKFTEVCSIYHMRQCTSLPRLKPLTRSLATMSHETLVSQCHTL